MFLYIVRRNTKCRETGKERAEKQQKDVARDNTPCYIIDVKRTNNTGDRMHFHLDLGILALLVVIGLAFWMVSRNDVDAMDNGGEQ